MRQVWKFETARFAVRLMVAEDYGYQYDGDDPDGETQAKLDSGEYVAFDSAVIVEMDGVVIGRDALGGSVYSADEMADFWTDHRSADPMNRNCEAMRAARGGRAVICHYFPGMVAQAVAEARAYLCNAPAMRCAAAGR